MPISITGSKYSAPLTAVSGRQITATGWTLTSADLGSPRIVGLWNSSGVYRGMSWVRRRISNTVLEIEKQFYDKYGQVITPVVGDVAHVSLNFADVSGTGYAVENNTVTLNDGIVFGTSNVSDSVCFYDERIRVDVRADGGNLAMDFAGGLVVFGHLIDYGDRTFYNSVSLSSAGTGLNKGQLIVTSESAKVWWMGGDIHFAQTPAYMPGRTSNTAAEFQKWWGIMTNADWTPAGSPWHARPADQQFVNCLSLPSSLNSIGFRLADASFEGGGVKISGDDAISAFGNDASGSYEVGAPSGKRFVVSDFGGGLATKTAFWRSDQTPTQQITARNVISADFKCGRSIAPATSPNNNATLTRLFTDPYSNPRPGTKIVIKRGGDGGIEASGESVSGETLDLDVQYGTVVGHTYTNTDTSWSWAAFAYGANIVTGTFEAYNVDTASGDAIDVKHGTTLLQSDYLGTTEQDKEVVATIAEISTAEEFEDSLNLWLYENFVGQTEPIVTRVGNTISTGTRSLRIDPTATALRSVTDDLITIRATNLVANLVIGGTLTVDAGAVHTGSARIGASLRASFTGLPAGADAVVGAWPVDDGDDRTNIITGTVGGATATSISLSLDSSTEYFVIADAVGYVRSSPVRFNAATTSLLSFDLKLILDTSGNAILPTALSVEEQALANLIIYDAANNTVVFSATAANEVIPFTVAAFVSEEIQSSTGALSNPRTLTILLNEIVIASDSSLKIGGAAGGVAYLANWTIRKEGTTNLTDFVDFTHPLAIRTEPPISASVSTPTAVAGEFRDHTVTALTPALENLEDALLLAAKS